MRNALGLALTATLALTGCPVEETIDCTAIAVSSVTVTLVDEGGMPIDDAVVTFSADGADAEPCDAFGDSWACGFEIEGPIEVFAEAPGFNSNSIEVDVASDECHVITEVVELSLQSIDCTDIALPAILVEVSDTQDTSITSATVEWTSADASSPPEPCEATADGRWACAEEKSGDLEVWVSEAGPYEDYVAMVFVEHDGCHPITVEHEAVLQFLAD